MKKKISRKYWFLAFLVFVIFVGVILNAFYKMPVSQKYCKSNSDCVCYDGCLCINKFYKGIVPCPEMASCTKFDYCECVNNTCVTKLNVKLCEKDDECILVQDGCCGCSMGGKNTAINKIHKDWWDNKISSECREIVCIAVISNDPTCFSEPRCVDGECKPIPK
jgi:hypothetical protein